MFIVEKMGLEPTTFWLPAKRSSQLSYIPVCERKGKIFFLITKPICEKSYTFAINL